MSDELTREAEKALLCLFIQLPEAIAKDVQQKVLAAFDAQRATIERLEMDKAELYARLDMERLKKEAVQRDAERLKARLAEVTADEEEAVQRATAFERDLDQLQQRLAAVTEERNELQRWFDDVAAAGVLDCAVQTSEEFIDWVKACTQQRDAALAKVREEQAAHQKTAKLFVDMQTYAQFVEQRTAELEAKVREHEQWESDHQMHTLVSPEQMAAYEQAEQRVTQLEALFEQCKRSLEGHVRLYFKSQARIERLKLALKDFVELFTDNFEDPGMEIFGLVDGKYPSASNTELNRCVDQAKQALADELGATQEES